MYGRSFRERGCNLIEETWEALENHLSRERHASLTLLKKKVKKRIQNTQSKLNDCIIWTIHFQLRTENSKRPIKLLVSWHKHIPTDLDIN